MGRHEIQAAPVCGRDVAASLIAHAPPTGQQIPVPERLAVKGLWTGGVKLCSQTEHES
jgi:hypothetical protein